jgi:hypothetical protein
LDRDAASLLAADLRAQWRVIEEVYRRVEERRRAVTDAPASVEALAYQLHNLYGACEQLFELIARAFENQIDARRYHADLLRRMKTEIEGVRPALLSDALERDLNELRAFRHFFRHAYGIELKADQVGAMAEVAGGIREPLKAALHRFASAILQGAEP